ncbi:hypothetical protein ABID58_006147 [Bradyrhizobium sp. S3.2.6]|uniref:DUF3606 domain-containing protein n=1 Tax=Bradyrhizobium cytisi TaxID=515489 RepID=A0A5S4WVG1_9BRAD|nr:hypothetical protein FXB38_23880 [Bradyrhizobium cytisi]
MSEDYGAKHWTTTQLQKAIDKLGNSAVSVRKELLHEKKEEEQHG